MALHRAQRDGESETEPGARALRLSPEEGLEHVGEILGRDARSPIAADPSDAVGVLREGHVDDGSLGRMAQRIAKNVFEGGVVFAPKPRDYRMSLNKKLKRVALKSALSAKVANEKLIVLDSIELPEQKTRAMVKVLANLKVEKALIVTSDVCDTVVRTARNIQGVATATVGTLNTYDVLKYDALILTKDAVEKVEEVYA